MIALVTSMAEPYTLRDTRADAAAAIVLRTKDLRAIETYLRAVGPGRVVDLALDVTTLDHQMETLGGDLLLALLADPPAAPAE